MSKSTIIGVIAAIPVSLLLSASEARGQDEAPRVRDTAQICNHLDEPIWAAVGYYDSDSETWFAEGWTRVRPYQCRELLADYTGPVYMYAEGVRSGWRYIPQEGYGKRFCVHTSERRWLLTEEDCQESDDEDMRMRTFGRVVDWDEDGITLYNVR